jgi:molybdenum cofactor cytidylyltransferase
MSDPNAISLILSAGESSRMGQIKALLPWREKTFLHHATQAARGGGVIEVVAVLGSGAGQIIPEADRLQIKHVLNPQWKQGMGSSLKAGLSWVRTRYPKASGVLIQLADQPRIDATHVRQMLRAHLENPGKIVVADYDGKVGVPAFFPNEFFPSLLALANESGAKAMLQNHLDRLIRIAVPEAAMDVDTPDQYERLLKL